MSWLDMRLERDQMILASLNYNVIQLLEASWPQIN